MPNTSPEDSGRPQNLGTTLRTARERKGLELSDIAETTHVRKEYLLALEQGRYADLPEDVYARNFLRLFAQAVGLDSTPLLDLYSRERHGGSASRSGVTQPRNADAGVSSGRSERVGPGGMAEPTGSSTPASTPSPTAPPAGAAAAPKGRRSPWGSERPTGPDRGAGAMDPGARATGQASSGSRPLRIPGLRIGSTIATLLLIVAIVAVALWAFNSLLFGGGRGSVATPPAADSGGIVVPPNGAPGATTDTPGDATETTPEATEQARDILLTVESEPPGAEVTVDGFPLPGTTPVQDVPVTGRASRLLRVTLDGYEPFESTYDLSFDRTLSVILEPEVIAEPETDEGVEATTSSGPPPVAGQGQIALNITEATWLEVYASTARQQGERLVYTTAQPGDRYMFELPVYVHVGNAAGVHVSVNGQDRGAFGSSGAVTGRAFTE